MEKRNAVINKKTKTSKLPSHFECNGVNIVSKQTIAKKITVADNGASIYDYNGTAMSQLQVY